MSDPDVIDQEALDRLREWGGVKLLGQMIRLFLANSPERMEQIRSGLEAGDAGEAERGSHSLKSSAANVGAKSVHELAAEMESAATREDLTAAGRMMPALEDAYGRACSALASLQPEES